MLKFYSTFIGKILISLLYFKDTLRREGILYDGNGIIQHMKAEHMRLRGGDPPQTQAKALAVNNLFQSIGGYYGDAEENWLNVDDIITELVNKLNASSAEGKESDLIDTVVKILKLEHSSNVISGKTLDNLRKAILLPDEIGSLKERLKTKEKSCTGCGRGFVGGEMVVVINDEHNLNAFVCTNCAHPTMVACGTNGCQDHMELPKKIYKSLFSSRCICEKCKNKNNEVKVEEEVDVAAAIANRDEVDRILIERERQVDRMREMRRNPVRLNNEVNGAIIGTQGIGFAVGTGNVTTTGNTIQWIAEAERQWIAEEQEPRPVTLAEPLAGLGQRLRNAAARVRPPDEVDRAMFTFNPPAVDHVTTNDLVDHEPIWEHNNWEDDDDDLDLEREEDM